MMDPLQLDRLAALCPWAIAAGFLVGILTGPTLTSFILVTFGAMGGSFYNWRSERGLWMLAALFLTAFGIGYAFVMYDQIAGLVFGRAGLAGWAAVDCAVGTLIWGVMVRFLWSVLRLNFWIRDGV